MFPQNFHTPIIYNIYVNISISKYNKVCSNHELRLAAEHIVCIYICGVFMHEA